MNDHEPYEYCCVEHYPMPAKQIGKASMSEIENERDWEEVSRNSPYFRETFAGKRLELHEALQALKQAIKQELPHPVWRVLHWLKLL